MRRTHSRSTPGGPSDEGPDGRPTDPCVCELEYEMVEPPSRHESWLFEWVLDCLALDGVVSVGLSRSDERSVSVLIRIEDCGSDRPTAIGDSDHGKVAELEGRVDDLSLSCYERNPGFPETA